MNNKSKFT